MVKQHIYHPYLICPYCNKQIVCTPDFEFYIRFIQKFGNLGKPVLNIQKMIPVDKILHDPTLIPLKNSLHDFIVKLATRKPFFCTAIITKESCNVINKMIDLNIVKYDEVYLKEE